MNNIPLDGYGPISQYLNDGTTCLAAVGAGEASLMLKVIFWLLLLLWAIGAIGFVNPANPNYPQIVRGTNIVLIILFGILGFYTFGF